MTFQVALLAGDGVGPEVVDAAVRVIDYAASACDLAVAYESLAVGGAAIERYGTPLRDEDLDRCRRADAVLLGAVGGPAWDALPTETRPERALLRLRAELELPINLRPIHWTSAGASRSPLKPAVAQNADIAFVRELTGGVYFGRPSFLRETPSGAEATDTAHYTEEQILAVVEFAFELARSRQGRVTSVDKANVMNTSRLWRRVATEYGSQHPDITLEHALVDSFAVALMQDPRQYDVVVTENLFGDILTDLAAAIAGSLGVLPSASLRRGSGRRRFGMYEPVHGSAPAIAGQGLANPVGCVLSAALMFEWSFDRPDLADMIRVAVESLLTGGRVTADLAGEGQNSISTKSFIDELLETMHQGGSRGRRNLRHHVA